MPNDIKQVFTIDVNGEEKLVNYKNQLVKTEKAGEDLENSNKGLTKSFGKLAGGIAGTAVAIKSAKLAWQLADLGARAITVDKNFQQFAQKGGKSVIGMMDQLRKASGGLMDDMFLQQQAMKAMISGVNFDDTIVAMEYVRKYALATGDDMNAKMQTVMTGLARGSAQFMDDVGIQVMGAEDVVGASIAQMKEKMGDFADTTDDTSTAIAGMKTEFENLKQYIGTTLTPTMKTMVTTLTGGLKTAREIVKGFRIGELESLSKKVQVFAEYEEKAMARRDKALAKYTKTGKDKYLDQANTIQKSMDLNTKSLKKAKTEYDALYKELYSVNSQPLPSNASPIIPKPKEIEESTKALKEYSRANDRMLKHILDASEVTQGAEFSEEMALFREYADSITVSESEAFEVRKSNLQEFMGSYASIVQQGMYTVASVFSSAYANQRSEIDAVAQAEKDAINNSTMGAKRKAKEIAKIEEKARKERHEAELKQWRVNVLMSIGNTALGVTAALARYDYAGAIATGVLGTISTGVIMSNKPKYYYGSRDGAGAYSEIGGSSQGDQIQANVRSGELIVQAGRDASIAKNALNGVTTSTNSTSQSFTVSPNITIQGNADESILLALPNMIVDTIQNATTNGLFNPSVSNVF